MDFDLKGYLENEPLAVSKPLLPLFEAVINAIHAEEDSTERNRQITIRIERDKRQGEIAIGELKSRPIVGFQVQDNGIGFTDENFESFNTSFSRYKRTRGGKGVGRFTWLQAFDETLISSKYIYKGEWYKREFKFSIERGGVTEHVVSKTDAGEKQTIVKLSGFKEAYCKSHYCPSKAETIALKLLEHFLFTFLVPSAPSVSILDDDEDVTISLNEMFINRISPFAQENDVIIKTYPFKLRHLRLYSGDPGQQHSIHLCANNREVVKINLSKKIPSLGRKIEDTDGKSFYYQCYVESPFLDERADVQRTAFSFSKDDELKLAGELTQEMLIDELVVHAKEQLGQYLNELYDNIKKKADALVTQKYPEYRVYLKEIDTYLDEFDQDVSDEQLLKKFNELHFEKDLETRKQADILLEKAEKGEYDKSYNDQFKHYCENIDDTAAVNLARYVIHRKTILNLLRKRMTSDKNGKYVLEEMIHEMIFPVRKSSDDAEFHRWNLWVINEKLAFHSYLSSDRPISDITGNSDHTKEPDIMVIDNPAAFTDTDISPLTSVVIIEFKRPERTAYGEEGENKNPIDQVQGYIRQIKDNKEVNIRGRRITVKENTPFYCYIIADLTPKLREIAEGRGFIQTPDDLGYFWFNQNNNAYVELISFDKLLQDAEQRNISLFKKLGLH